MKFTKKELSSYLIVFLISLFIISCSKDDPASNTDPVSTEKNITILYTNDEHGWMEPVDEFGGAAGMMGIWRNTEGYTENGSFLILSGGDMWTGPALSTWFEGESMAEVMNAMDYSAAAIGNHEVDFGIDRLTERSNHSNFPFLSANIVETGTNNSPPWCRPYTIKQVSGISVGIIGLTTLTMPGMVFPETIAGLEFQAYATALNRVVPQVKSEGAELLILIAHMSAAELRSISSLANQHGIALMGGGHAHEEINEICNGVTIIEAGSKMRAYAKAEITFDTETDEVVSITSGYYPNIGGAPDATIAGIVSVWTEQAEGVLTEIIGYTNSTINQSSDQMYNLITDSWLYSFPNADISISNRGGVRQSIPAGNITVATIMGVLPFENEIIEMEITGTELTNLMNNIKNYAFVGGMTTIGGYTLSDGTPINPGETYKVLTTDFYYSITTDMQTYDPTPEYTYVNWRQPVIDYLKYLSTSSADPLDNYLDYSKRQTPQFVFEY